MLAPRQPIFQMHSLPTTLRSRPLLLFINLETRARNPPGRDSLCPRAEKMQQVRTENIFIDVYFIWRALLIAPTCLELAACNAHTLLWSGIWCRTLIILCWKHFGNMQSLLHTWIPKQNILDLKKIDIKIGRIWQSIIYNNKICPAHKRTKIWGCFNLQSGGLIF